MSRLLLETEFNVSEDDLCDRLSVRELHRLADVDWPHQIERRRERLTKLTFLTEDMTK